VVPTGFSASLAGAAPRSLGLVTRVDSQLAAEIASSIVSSYTAQVNADRLAVMTALRAGAPASTVAELGRLVSSARIPLSAVERPIGAHQLTVMSYYSPAMAIFFLLFTISYVARSFFSDKAAGMIERMRAAPLRPAEILAGKALSVLVYGILSLGTVALITSVAFGADWGSPLPVALVCLVFTLSIVSLTALVIGLARTQRQSDGIASLIIFALALLGGNFVFVSSAAPIMQRLALLTPNGWALRAFSDLSTTGGGLATVVEPVAAILAFTVVAGGVALRLAPRAVRS
jgi:ABC-2 type transport system permease protein